MTRQDHWKRMRYGEREMGMRDIVSVNIIINILYILMYMVHNTNNLYHYIYISQNE